MSDRKERRRSPRIKAEHELVLRAEGDDGFTARSVDLNLGGIYCELDRHIPLFTKLGIDLTLPVALRDGDEEELFRLQLEAVVVRIEPEEPEPGHTEYSAAMAFVSMDPEEELVIARYLLRSIQQGV